MHTVTNAIPSGTVSSIPAKAHAHRALICAALATSPSTIVLSKSSKDIDATIDSLRDLGAHIVYDNQIITVTPGPVPAAGQIRPHESGTTLRLLLPVAASICDTVEVDAKGRLPERPLEPMLGEMKSHGVSFSKEAPPFTMTGRLQGGNFAIVGDVSSQFFSGLLLAAPQLNGSTITCTTPLQSRDYVRLTTETMKDFGVHVEYSMTTIDNLQTQTNKNIKPSKDSINNTVDQFIVPSGSVFTGREGYHIEGDWSNTAIWMVAAAMTGQPITVAGMNKESIQADRRIAKVIEDVGCQVHWEGMNITVSGRATTPIQADLEQMPDMLPVMAALACSIKGESAFINGARLRLKESDRLVAVANLVRDLGGSVREKGDDLYIIGSGTLRGGMGDCVNDHRLVMAGTLMALISESPVTLKDSEAITKSYPHFFDDWNMLGGNAHVI